MDPPFTAFHSLLVVLAALSLLSGVVSYSEDAIMKPKRMLHCSDVNCSLAIRSWIKVMDEGSGFSVSESNDKNQCELVNQTVWITWSKKVCLSFMTFETPIDDKGNAKDYHVKLFVHPGDTLPFDEDFFLDDHPPEQLREDNRKFTAFVVPFCTKKVIGQFTTCKRGHHDNEGEYVYAWELKPQFYGVNQSWRLIPKPGTQRIYEILETMEATKHPPPLSQHETSSTGAVHDTRTFIFVSGLAAILVVL